jgi:CheY-like chemotaxis protein
MPGLDGFEVLRRIRESDARASRQTRAIAVSAHATEEHAARSIGAGFDRHIGKPYQIHDLLQTIHSVLLSTAK